jgi:hypothetical protein
MIFGKKDGLFNYNVGLGDYNFSASDQVGTRDTRIGHKYQVSCSQSDPLLSKSSNELEVVGCQSCEIPYQQEADLLQSGKPSHITEVNPKNWLKDEDRDFTGLHAGGSGDARDVFGFMTTTQCDYMQHCVLQNGSCPPPQPVYFNSEIFYKDMLGNEWSKLITDAKQRVNTEGYPTLMSIRSLNWQVKVSGSRIIRTSHSVILVGISGSDSQGYDFDIVDPNVPDKVTSLNDCRSADIRITYDGQTSTDSGLACSPLSYWSTAGPVFIREINLADSYTRAKAYADFCNNAQNSANYKELCGRDKLTDWLKGNLADLVNVGSEASPGGTCFGWADFYLRMTYLSDFVGKDFHSDDGTMVGRDCDANHYPMGKSALAPTSRQLASVTQTDLMTSIIKSLNDLLLKLKTTKP